jgi:hypothetical protein
MVTSRPPNPSVQRGSAVGKFGTETRAPLSVDCKTFATGRLKVADDASHRSDGCIAGGQALMTRPAQTWTHEQAGERNGDALRVVTITGEGAHGRRPVAEGAQRRVAPLRCE